jgi:hypothetical protein
MFGIVAIFCFDKVGMLLAMMCENWVHRIHKFSDNDSEKLGGYLLRVTLAMFGIVAIF